MLTRLRAGGKKGERIQKLINPVSPLEQIRNKARIKIL